ncbi:DUF3997 domain-containing protein [Anatilimnocola sp. NA78]|uniref:DUF3997 domain-containing protein n=1 Tax=Anatilimnocola sp. NA78 TaxID=3415683 RepID=UPI003CE58EA1
MFSRWKTIRRGVVQFAFLAHAAGVLNRMARMKINSHHSRSWTAVGILLLTALAGCRARDFGFAGAADFSAQLPQGFVVYRTSAHQIAIAPKDSPPVIPAKVIEIDHDDLWLIAKQQHLRQRKAKPNDTYEEPDPGVFSYWILRFDTTEVRGPLSLVDFESQRKKLNVPASLKLHSVHDYRL